MGKHERSYLRVERDHYPTPAWVVAALAEYVNLNGRDIWEPATGSGQMAEALKDAGAARVYCTDIVKYDYPLDALFDFTSIQRLNLAEPFDMITNPAFGPRGKTAEAFIEAGLRRISRGEILALLLPADFDSAKTRARFFSACAAFLAKIVLTRRIVWFNRSDGEREAPKENHAWFVWSQPDVLRIRKQPIILYAPNGERQWAGESEREVLRTWAEQQDVS